MNKDPLQRAYNGIPVCWENDDSLGKWKEQVKIGDIVQIFGDRHAELNVGIVTHIHYSPTEEHSDELMVFWILRQKQTRCWAYNLYPIELGALCKHQY